MKAEKIRAGIEHAAQAYKDDFKDEPYLRVFDDLLLGLGSACDTWGTPDYEAAKTMAAAVLYMLEHMQEVVEAEREERKRRYDYF